MTASELSILSKWYPMILIPVLFILGLGLSCWLFTCLRRRRKASYSHSKKLEKEIQHIKTISPKSVPKRDHVSPLTHHSSTKISSKSASQFTNTDVAYLDKLVRTASDRSLWKRDDSTKDPQHKPRKVPSGQIPSRV